MQQLVKKQNEIKRAIPYGGLTEIAEHSGTSIYTVSRVVNGKSRNRKVLSEIDKYLDELKMTHEGIKNSIAVINQ